MFNVDKLMFNYKNVARFARNVLRPLGDEDTLCVVFPN